jgi:hypothetical protein
MPGQAPDAQSPKRQIRVAQISFLFYFTTSHYQSSSGFSPYSRSPTGISAVVLQSASYCLKMADAAEGKIQILTCRSVKNNSKVRLQDPRCNRTRQKEIWPDTCQFF